MPVLMLRNWVNIDFRHRYSIRKHFCFHRGRLNVAGNVAGIVQVLVTNRDFSTKCNICED